MRQTLETLHRKLATLVRVKSPYSDLSSSSGDCPGCFMGQARAGGRDPVFKLDR